MSVNRISTLLVSVFVTSVGCTRKPSANAAVLQCGKGTHNESGTCVADAVAPVAQLPLPPDQAPPPPRAKPTKDTVLERFGFELSKYGTLYGQVMPAPRQGAHPGFRKLSPGQYRSPQSNDVWCPRGGYQDISVKDVELDENDDDHYPYAAMIAYESKGHCFLQNGLDSGDPVKRHSVGYLYGGKTNKWKQR